MYNVRWKILNAGGKSKVRKIIVKRRCYLLYVINEVRVKQRIHKYEKVVTKRDSCQLKVFSKTFTCKIDLLPTNSKTLAYEQRTN